MRYIVLIYDNSDACQFIDSSEDQADRASFRRRALAPARMASPPRPRVSVSGRPRFRAVASCLDISRLGAMAPAARPLACCTDCGGPHCLRRLQHDAEFLAGDRRVAFALAACIGDCCRGDQRSGCHRAASLVSRSPMAPQKVHTDTRVNAAESALTCLAPCGRHVAS